MSKKEIIDKPREMNIIKVGYVLRRHLMTILVSANEWGGHWNDQLHFYSHLNSTGESDHAITEDRCRFNSM